MDASQPRGGDGSAAAPFDTLDDALAAGPGVVISIAGGTYTGPFVLDAGQRLVGDCVDDVVIDGPFGITLAVDGPAAALINLTVEGSVDITNTSLRLENVRLRYGLTGITARDSTVVASLVTLEPLPNAPLANWNAVVLSGRSSFGVLDHASVTGRKEKSGWLIDSTDGALHVADIDIRGAVNGTAAVALRSVAGVMHAQDVYITGARAGLGGIRGADVAVRRVVLEDSDTAIFALSSTLSVESSTITSSSIFGLYARADSPRSLHVEIRRSSFRDGGGIAIVNGSVALEDVSCHNIRSTVHSEDAIDLVDVTIDRAHGIRVVGAAGSGMVVVHGRGAPIEDVAIDDTEGFGFYLHDVSLDVHGLRVRRAVDMGVLVGGGSDVEMSEVAVDMIDDGPRLGAFRVGIGVANESAMHIFSSTVATDGPATTGVGVAMAYSVSSTVSAAAARRGWAQPGRIASSTLRASEYGLDVEGFGALVGVDADVRFLVPTATVVNLGVPISTMPGIGTFDTAAIIGPGGSGP